MSHGPVPHRHAHPLDKIPARPPTPQWTVDVVLEINGEWHDYERIGAVKELNSGGTVILLVAGPSDRARAVLRLRVGRHSDRQRDERDSVEDELPRAHRARLCVRGAAMSLVRASIALLAGLMLASGAQAHSHKLKSLEIVHPWCMRNGGRRQNRSRST